MKVGILTALNVFLSWLRKEGAVRAVVFSAVSMAFGGHIFWLMRKRIRSSDILASQLRGPAEDKGIVIAFILFCIYQRGRINQWILEMTKKYGRNWHLAHFLILTTPSNVEHILKTNFSNYIKGPEFTFNFGDVLGQGIFNVNGDSWKVQRKAASHMFSRKNFATFMSEIFVHHGHTVLEILEKASKNGECIDLQEIFFKFTLDSIGQIGFGTELGILKQGRLEFSDAFDQSQARILQRIVNPFWPLIKYISVAEWEQEKRLKIITDFTRKIIEKRRQEDVNQKMDILSFFMARVDENGNPFNESYLQDIVMNFIIAGRDTTACTLSWSMYCLASYPEVERRVLEEIDEVLKGAQPTFEDVDTRLPYLHAFIKEVLRLYPPVPKDMKTTVQDDVLPDGTFVPESTVVVYSPYIMGRLEEMYENPLNFDPTRWFDPNNAKKTPYEYPVFQAGPRTCLGQAMAFFESKLLISMILQRYQLRLRPGAQGEPLESITMPIAGGLPVYVHKRKEFFSNQVNVPSEPLIGPSSKL